MEAKELAALWFVVAFMACVAMVWLSVIVGSAFLFNVSALMMGAMLVVTFGFLSESEKQEGEKC